MIENGSGNESSEWNVKWRVTDKGKGRMIKNRIELLL